MFTIPFLLSACFKVIIISLFFFFFQNTSSAAPTYGNLFYSFSFLLCFPSLNLHICLQIYSRLGHEYISQSSHLFTDILKAWTWTNTAEDHLCARYCIRQFAQNVSFSPHRNLKRLIWLLACYMTENNTNKHWVEVMQKINWQCQDLTQVWL